MSKVSDRLNSRAEKTDINKNVNKRLDSVLLPEFSVPVAEEKHQKPIIVTDPNYIVGNRGPDNNQQVWHLEQGWNYIGFNVLPDPFYWEGVSGIKQLFMELTYNGHLQYVSSNYPDLGWVYWDPVGLESLNTLTEMRSGYGYALRMHEPHSFIVNGTPIDPTMIIPLYPGWNFIAYLGINYAHPADAFSDLIEEGVLDFVSTLDPITGESKYFDSHQPEIFNTLTEMQEGVGYTIKLTFDSNQYPDGYIPFQYESTTPEGTEVLIVDVNGEGDFVTIQEAIDASNNDINTDIIIKPGTYTESVWSIAKKNYNLKGEGEVIWVNKEMYNDWNTYGGHFHILQCSIDTGSELVVFLTENISIDNITFISNLNVLYGTAIYIMGPMNNFSLTNCTIDQSNLMLPEFPYKSFAELCANGEDLGDVAPPLGDYAVINAKGIRLVPNLLASAQGTLPPPPFHKGGIRNIAIENNVIAWGNHTGISITPLGPFTGPEPTVADVMIANNEIHNCFYGFVNSESPFLPSSTSSNVTFDNNYFTGNCLGIFSHLRNSNFIENEFNGNHVGLMVANDPLIGGAPPNSYVENNIWLNNSLFHTWEYDTAWSSWSNDELVFYNENYWDDYTGLDQNGDGFGDTPYWINTMSGNGRGFDPNPRMEF